MLQSLFARFSWLPGMTFYVQGLNSHELMPLNTVFKGPAISNTQAIAAARGIDEKDSSRGKSFKAKSRGQPGGAAQAYEAVKDIPQQQTVVLAHQIMSSPVLSLGPESSAEDALNLFHTRNLRHVPIISPSGALVGIVSERDVLRYLAGMTKQRQAHLQPSASDQVAHLMQTPVLTASLDTDIRDIARLFVEKQVGALPIVDAGKLHGIIARSDILTAVMRHFMLELWA